MNKLQLYITKSGNVFKSLLNLNPNEDVRRFVVDIRNAVERIDYVADEKNIFYYITATNEGSFFTIIRTIPPKHGAHLAAWIYIPTGTRISDAELADIVALTTRKVSGSEVSNDDVAVLREAFAKVYPVDSTAPALTACAGHKYAWRTYGEDSGLSLRDFTGRGRWQQDYIPYRGVLIIDDMLGYDVTADSLAHLPLSEQATILVPEPSADGFRPYVFNRPLDRPLAASLDRETDFVWRKPGFEDVVVPQIIDSLEFTPQTVSTQGSLKKITPASFFITSQVTHEPLSKCLIRVNGHEISENGRQFTGDELRQASVSITCDGHFPFSGQLDLASTTRALIQLQERRKIYRFELPLISSDFGAPVQFELHTKNEMSQSPLEGYVLLDEIQEGASRTNHLGYSGSGTSLSTKLIYAAVGFVAGLVLMLIFGTCSNSKSNESSLAPAANPDSIVKTEVPPVVAPPTPPILETEPQVAPAASVTEPVTVTEPSPATDSKLTLDDAIKYLDNNKAWNRDELEKNPATRGLFDDLNNFRTQRIIEHWGPVLKDSKELQRVVKHVSQGAQKKKAKLPDTYNKPGDNVISVQSYLNKVDP